MTDALPGAKDHIAAALALCAKIDDLPADTPLIAINKVGVIGAGTMGGGIAMNFLSAGIPVTIVEQEQAALDRGVGVMGKNYEASVKRGRIEECREAVGRALESLNAACDPAGDRRSGAGGRAAADQPAGDAASRPPDAHKLLMRRADWLAFHAELSAGIKEDDVFERLVAPGYFAT